MKSKKKKVIFELESHSVEGEYFLKIYNEVFWMTKKELIALRRLLDNL